MKNILNVRSPIDVNGNILNRICFVSLITAGLILSRFNWRGIGSLSKLFRYLKIGGDNDLIVPLWMNRKIEIGTGDYYWSRLIFSNYVYEPEIQFALDKFLTPDAIFLDLGANIGYWSIFCSTIIQDKERIVAVEAGAKTFNHLERNMTLNDGVFTILKRAVSDKGMMTVKFFTAGHDHASAQIKTNIDGNDDIVESVETISIDEILSDIAPYTGIEDVIIKLDVEGAEVLSMIGAKQLLEKKNCLIIYEDHGNDPDCKISDFFLNEINFDIFYIEGNSVTKMSNLKKIRSKKVNKKFGYNFCACYKDSNFSEKFNRLCSQ